MRTHPDVAYFHADGVNSDEVSYITDSFGAFQ